ncbi:MAG: helicase [Chloroflexi bacterium RBG_16_57_11]|nr:MAG: helicase [Chloroflexi bacterium RBG_16_57_11]
MGMEIKPGSIIHGSRWPEPVEVTHIEDRGAYIRVVGATTQTHAHIDQLLPKSELEGIQGGESQPLYSANPRHVFLALETHRYRYASLYDPLLAMNTCKIDPLPHQIEAVYGYVLRLPRIRFLIADDPGAGKTIMAGLVIKELKLRHLVRRILIVAPGHLKDQWRRELKERFEEHFTVVDRGIMDAFYGENVWARESQVITSLDFAKQDDILASLSAIHYDLIIVDEAHKMSAYRYGEKLDKTSRYRLGETLSDISTHILFLTATPHRGDPENFRLFLDLLEPGFFADTQMVAASIREQDNPLFIRRIKEDLKDFEGKPLFLPRYVETKSFNLGIESYPEKELYNGLSRYVNEQYNKALTKDKRRNVAFALVILQRRLASSTYALHKSLERRKKRLEELLQGAAQGGKNDIQGYDPETVEDMSEEERWRQEEVWEPLSVAENRQELEAELRTLADLIQMARAIVETDPPVEVKLRHLKASLEQLNQQQPGAKILIFTESRDTLYYLERCIRQWGYTICTIHGGMKLDDRVKAEAIFKNEAQIMVATEAAGEGINLQFCNLMINYDIPWNPNRLEQRMGRIHRYGQTREVFIFNLVASDTREGRVLTALFNKLDEIRAALGSDKVFDVLGDIIQGKNLAQLLVEAAANARSVDEILREIEIKVDAEYLAGVRENLGESLATRYIDYTRIKEMADQAREHRLIPEYTEAFFKRAMDELGGKWAPRSMKEYPIGSFLSVDSVPFALRQIAEEDTFKKRHGPLLRRYPLITFDKDAAMRLSQAEFVTFGDPLFEAILLWVERNLDVSLAQGATFTDPDGLLDGVLLFYQGEIRDGQGEVAGTRLFALFADSNSGEFRSVNPAILWDLSETNPPLPQGKGSGVRVDLDNLKTQAWGVLLPEMEAYRQTLLDERQRQAVIKEKYGLQSLTNLILKLDGDLIDLQIRQERGNNVDLVMRNKQEQKDRYEQALADLQTSLSRQRNLTLSAPRFLGATRVIPAQVAGAEAAMKSDAEIERIGMQVAMKFELDDGWLPEDISAQNLGFDIRSIDGQGAKRYIEVKARARTGPVSLTQNEWFKAQRFKDEYYLYVVLNAATQPELYCIQNPAVVLQPEELMEVRYLISVAQIVENR